ncbi:uncharacterized protein [Fopius arisanus]|uniref:Uncharacterized protein n=1 Tax=Fopius arisanus TaxID=64838 RepID=A0A9R1T380_9HYME|nr:PREDICTED: uncharacterized protein LOC105265858 [Fopius arisanus]
MKMYMTIVFLVASTVLVQGIPVPDKTFQERAQEALDSVKEKAGEAWDYAQDVANRAVESAKSTVQEALGTAQETSKQGLANGQDLVEQAKHYMQNITMGSIFDDIYP